MNERTLDNRKSNILYIYTYAYMCTHTHIQLHQYLKSESFEYTNGKWYLAISISNKKQPKP